MIPTNINSVVMLQMQSYTIPEEEEYDVFSTQWLYILIQIC